MNSLRKVNMLCDVMLKVEGQEFPVHRIVLAACSDYFCAMFTNQVSCIRFSVLCIYHFNFFVQDWFDYLGCGRVGQILLAAVLWHKVR